MTHAFALDATADREDRKTAQHGVTFWVSVLILLTFSQCWVMPLTGPDGDPESSSLIRLCYFPAYFAALALAAARFKATLAAMIRTPLLWGLIAMAFVSMIWSVDPEVTTRRGIAVLFTTLAAAVIGVRYDWPAFLEVLGATFVVLVALCFALAVLMPSYGRMTTLFPGAWRGVWFEKNGLGNNMALGCMVLFAAAILNPKRAWFWALMGVLAMALVWLSTSKTSLVALAIGLGVLGFVVVVKRGPALAVIATFVGVTAVIGFIGAAYFASDALFALVGKDATLTGRTKIWAAVLNQIHTRPWTGFGYGAVWNDRDPWGPFAWITKQAGFVAGHAHNSWLEIWLGMGYVGLALWALLFTQTGMLTLAAIYRRPAGYFAAPFLIIYALMTVTESVVLVYNDFIWVMFAALAVKLAVPSRSVDRPVA